MGWLCRRLVKSVGPRLLAEGSRRFSRRCGRLATSGGLGGSENVVAGKVTSPLLRYERCVDTVFAAALSHVRPEGVGIDRYRESVTEEVSIRLR